MVTLQRAIAFDDCGLVRPWVSVRRCTIVRGRTPVRLAMTGRLTNVNASVHECRSGRADHDREGEVKGYEAC